MRHEGGTAVLQCQPQPVHGLFDFTGLQQDRGVIGLAAEIAGLGRAPIPRQRGLRIASDVQAIFQMPGQQVHRLGVAQMRRAGIQRQRLCAVLRHATAGGQQVGQVVQAPVQTGVGRAPVPDRGKRRIGGGALAQLMAAAEHVHRHRRAVVGCGLVPEQGRSSIFRRAFAFHVHLREQQLRLDLPGVCRIAHARKGGLRVVQQQVCQGVGIKRGVGSHARSIAGNKNGGRRSCRRVGAAGYIRTLRSVPGWPNDPGRCSRSATHKPW
ncbi:hypothetical protein D3C73_824810 [compost metagenome]